MLLFVVASGKNTRFPDLSWLELTVRCTRQMAGEVRQPTGFSLSLI